MTTLHNIPAVEKRKGKTSRNDLVNLDAHVDNVLTHEFGGSHLADVSLNGQLRDQDPAQLLEIEARKKGRALPRRVSQQVWHYRCLPVWQDAWGRRHLTHLQKGMRHLRRGYKGLDQVSAENSRGAPSDDRAFLFNIPERKNAVNGQGSHEWSSITAAPLNRTCDCRFLQACWNSCDHSLATSSKRLDCTAYHPWLET